MCLDKISKPSFLKRILGLQPESGTGYKIFLKEDGILRSAVIGRAVSEGTWIVDDNPEHGVDDGFHIYTRLSDVRRSFRTFIKQYNVIRRVQYRNVVTYGYGDGISSSRRPVVVARQMFIEPGDVK